MASKHGGYDSDDGRQYIYSVPEGKYKDDDDLSDPEDSSSSIDEEYSVNHRMSYLKLQHGPSMKRGYVLIIINYRFPDGINDLSKGNDIQEIKELFGRHGYAVRSFTNLRPDKMLEKVVSYASKEDSQSFVCFLSSHGNTTSLLGADGEDVRIKDIFRAANTRELRKKPKTFFIDACRTKRNERIRERDFPEIPSDTFFVGFSCLATKKSRTGNDSCGAYFEALISVFQESFEFPATSRKKRRNINYLVQKASGKVKGEQKPEMRSTLVAELFLQGEDDEARTQKHRQWPINRVF